MPYEYDCGNGIIWRIPDEEKPPSPKRKIRIVHPELSEAQEAVKQMREIYLLRGIPVPQWEEDFGQAMIEAEKAPVVEAVPEKETIPPMPEYGTQEFFLWCRKTKKAREALAAEKAAEKEAKKAEKEAEKAKKEAKKKPEKTIVKVKPRIKVTNISTEQ